MDAQGIMAEARFSRMRDMKDEIARLKAENARLRDENAMYARHMSLAVLAAADLARLPPGGRFVIVDGWNLVLGSGRVARSQDELAAQARRYLEDNPRDFMWIVFDGPRGNAALEPRLRMSYTGGEGAQRADRLICDFVRMARLSGEAGRIDLVTNDKGLAKEASKIAGRSDMRGSAFRDAGPQARQDPA